MRVDATLQAQAGEHPLDGIAVAGPLGFQRDQLTMQLPAVLILGRGRMDDGPDLLLAVVPTHKHTHELDGVEAVGLGSALAAIDLDARRIDDEVLDAVSPEEAIEPEAVASGFVTGDDLGIPGKPEACLGGLNLGQEQIKGAGAMVRSLGFCPAPIVKASFQVSQPSSREK